jgi:hypothetical protein
MVAASNLQASMRAAAVDLLTDYAADQNIKLQVYPARPRSLFPPSAFVDKISEKLEWSGTGWPQRTVSAEVMVVHGVFDTAEAATQRDAFVDGFVYFAAESFDAAGTNTTLALVSVEDEPAWQPDWRPANTTNGPEPIYYATRLTLEGFAGG